jgi:dipeptidyl aminopeptidase/acylaminoacyl peptidase
MVKVWDAGTGQELSTLQGHTGWVSSVAFSPDGQRLASGGASTVKVWDAGSGREILSLKGHTGGVETVAFSPDGRRIASGGHDTTVKVWDADSGQEILSLKGHTRLVQSVAFSPDGRHLASGGADNTVRLWDAGIGQEVFTLQGHTSGHSDGVLSVAFSPDGRRIASGGADNTVRVWDAGSGEEVLTLQGHKDRVTSVAFSPDGRRLASGSGDSTVRVWETGSVSADDLKRREIVKLVHDVRDVVLLRSEVMARLRKDPTLDAATREAALQVAGTLRDDPEQWNNAVWQVVRAPGAARDAYALALRQAEAAVQLDPGNGKYLTTLCGAHYRVGDWAKALETLERSGKLNGPKYGAHPADLAFLAMALHQLGQEVEAQATLARLREVMKQSFWKPNAEAQGFLREAEELIDGKPADKKP